MYINVALEVLVIVLGTFDDLSRFCPAIVGIIWGRTMLELLFLSICLFNPEDATRKVSLIILTFSSVIEEHASLSALFYCDS